MTVAEIVTNQILTRMKEAEEQGKTFYWVKPFAKGQPRGAFSYDTRMPYHGINRLLLDNDEYLTYNKIQELSAREHTELKPAPTGTYKTRPLRKRKSANSFGSMPNLSGRGMPQVEEGRRDPPPLLFVVGRSVEQSKGNQLHRSLRDRIRKYENAINC